MRSRVLTWKVDLETILYYNNLNGYSSFHSSGVTLPTGDRFHSIPICVAVNIHATTQKAAPLASTILPYLSWKSEGFSWFCLDQICWMLRILNFLSAFLVKGNIMKVWQDCSWWQLLVGCLATRPGKTRNMQWHLISVPFLPPNILFPLLLREWPVV